MKRSIPLSHMRLDLDENGGIELVQDVIYDRVRKQFASLDRDTLQRQADKVRHRMQTSGGPETSALCEILSALDYLVATR